MFEIMIFLFLFFIGIIVLFWGLYKKLDAQTRILGDEHAQMRVLLRAMESRLDRIMQIEKLNAMLEDKLSTDDLPKSGSTDPDDPGHDPLLHLSFDQPAGSANLINPGLDLNLDPEPEWKAGISSAGEKKS